MTFQAFVKSRIRQLQAWQSVPLGEIDYQLLTDDCAALLDELRQRAISAGLTVAVQACDVRGVRGVETALAGCLAACPPELLTVKQAAEVYGIGERTLYRLVERGELTHTRIGKTIRLKPSDLEQYLANPANQSAESLFD
jgi:excisionase family DNA binding protein